MSSRLFKFNIEISIATLFKDDAFGFNTFASLTYCLFKVDGPFGISCTTVLLSVLQRRHKDNDKKDCWCSNDDSAEITY